MPGGRSTSSPSRFPFAGPQPLRRHLVLLVACVLLPVTAFSVLVVERLAESQRAAAERRLMVAAGDLAASLDRELASTARALDALAKSDDLERGDLTAFRDEAVRAMASQPSWSYIVLRDADGRALVDTLAAPGKEIARAKDVESVTQTLQTRRTVVGVLVVGASHTLVFPVRVPVAVGGQVRYALTAAVRPDALAGLVAGQHNPDDEWSRGIIDAHGTIVARTREPEQYVGKPGSPTYLASIRNLDHGFIRTVTVDGRPVYSAFQRSTICGWTAGVGASADAIDGPVRRSVLTVSAVGVAMLLLSAVGAVVLSRRVSRGIAGAAVAAQTLARGHDPDLPASSIAEVVNLHDSLRRSAQLLASRQCERDLHLANTDAARADAEAASRAKDEFLAMLGHELRNPLAPIRTGVHLLTTFPPGDPRAGDVHRTIERQVTHLARLVDDLLDASRVARGLVGLEPQPLDLAAVVRDVVTDVGPQFERAGITLRVNLPTEPQIVPVNGDRTRLAQCLGNLLHNALKFTPASGQVTVTLARTDTHAELSVRDDGIGIPPELLPRLFQPFAQGPQTLGRTQGGLGLGLALVRGLITLHGGTTAATSDGPGSGATFAIRLPLTDQPIPAPPASATPAPSPPRSRQVLVVEDFADAAKMLKVLLRADGHDVRLAPTAAAALDAVASFTPDVILCDIGLPDMDGYELCKRFRTLPALHATRMIALTGYGQAEDVARAMAVGFDLHLTKPIDVAVLRRAIIATSDTL